MNKLRRRTGDNPTRRVMAPNALTTDELLELSNRVHYAGSGHHKRNPLDYGLERTNPRPTKSLCDAKRTIRLREAQALLITGIEKCMISAPTEDGLPKYVWSVSDTGEAFEAKTHPNTPGAYHGYPLEDEDDMRARVIEAWSQR
ncbi:hypothetical protein [Azovibrio restrictus]|uniref:hypothetical protein n=1 Tax=Azovibrio restrictus TaxID=146938 RepID=UPI0026EF0F84|nr:hypothetical protein [Azovibrio restrictus]MDD3484084.1 hypothetical protein [Azovibrio restrictus]